MVKKLSMHSGQAFLKKVAASILAVALLLGVVGYESVRVTREQTDGFALITHTYEVRETIHKIVEGIRNAGTTQRAYVLRGRSEDLANFDEALLELSVNIVKLTSLVAYNPQQTDRTKILVSQINKRIEDLTNVVGERVQREIPVEEQQIASLRSVTQLEDIVSIAEELTAEENRVLAIRLDIAAQARNRAQILVLSGLGLSLIVVLLSGAMIFRDVRRRLTVERNLRDNAELLEKTLNLQRTIVDSAGYAIIASDIQGKIKQFNPAAEKLLGYRAHEVIDKMNLAEFHDGAEIADRDKALSRELLSYPPTAFNVVTARARQGGIDESEWLYTRKNGIKIPVQLSVAAVHDSDRRITGFLTIAGDISERKKIERLKTEFISTVSHELRTPLTSIRGSLGLILGGVLGEIPAQAKGLLVIANKNVERLSRLINDILDTEKIESGKMDFQIKQQRLAPLLQQAMEGIIDYGRQFDVVFDLHNQAPDCEAAVDSDRFLQVMANLMSNAAKFSPPGGTVDITVNRQGPAIRISVIDKGKGIPADFHDRVFEKFAQADGSDTKQKSGTGLGLSITKSIVEKMAGTISFESEEENGTTFHVDFPENGIAVPVALSLKTARNINRPTVLVCENDPDIAKLLQLMLGQGGYDSEIVATAADAKDRLRTRSYLALSLNIDLPDRNGLDLFHELRADPLTRDLPVIVVSAQAVEGKRALNGSAIGVIDWLAKPIDRDRLMNAVHMAVQGQKSRKARILHIDDDFDITHIVAEMISPIAIIDSAHNLREARAKLATGPYDLILLDLVLPDGDGAEILSMLDSSTPIVIFSAHDVPEVLTRQVSTALTKSRTSNDQLLDSITKIIRPQPQLTPT